MSPKHNLLNLLVKIGLLEKLPSAEILDASDQGAISFLAARGILNEKDTLQKLSVHLKIPYIDIEALETQSLIASWSPFDSLPSEFCLAHHAAPLYQEGEQLILAIDNPMDFEVAKTVEFACGFRVAVVLAEEGKILKHLCRLFPRLPQSYDQLGSLGLGGTIEILGAPRDQGEGSDEQEEGIIQLANSILAEGIQRNASDIHIEPGQSALDVRQRLDGGMQNVLEVPKRLQGQLISRFKILAGMDIAERRRPQDGRFQVRCANELVDIRASCIPTSYGEKLVFRLLRADANTFSFDHVGIPADVRDSILSVLNGRSKLLLTTGPTGSGKTTTLYSCLTYLKDGTCNIETVEDPVEQRIAGINQIQINEAIKVTFASALRSVLRQDPDVIMIGEIRDAETADIAFQAGQTGHLVLSTLHTNDAPSAITRLLNLNLEPHTIATGLAGVIAQRLIRKLCQKCSKPLEESQFTEEMSKLLTPYDISSSDIRIASGCFECSASGFKGRVGLFSYLEIDSVISEMIQQRSPLNKIVEHAEKNKFKALDIAAVELLKKGIVSFDEIKEYVVAAKRSNTFPITSTHAAIPLGSEPKPSVAELLTQSGSIEKPVALVVDDDKDVRAIFSMILKKEMYEVIEASNGLEGLEKIYARCPEIILCDLMMPVMDGKELLIKLRSSDRTKNVPVVILTAAHNEENEIALIDLGAKDFINKTSSPKVITSRLRRILSS